MIRGVLRDGRVLFCGLLPNFVAEEVSLEEYKKLRGLHIEDPWERVKIIFSTDDHGSIHPELKYAQQMFQLGIGVGAIIGGLTHSSGKMESFMRQNEANIFSNRKEAISSFANHNLLTFMKGSLKWAPAFGLFCGAFSLVASCCEAYRGKPHILDSTAAGFVVGGLSRFMLGIKGMISGAVVGSTLGTMYGIVVWSLSKVSSADQVELKYAQFAYTNYKKQLEDHLKTKPQEGDEAIVKSGLHSVHVHNPINELDKDKQEPVNISK